MVGNIVKGSIEIAGGLVIVSFLLIIVAMFFSVVVYIVKDTFKNDSRITRQALVSAIGETEKDDDIELEVTEHLQEIEDKVNKGE